MQREEKLRKEGAIRFWIIPNQIYMLKKTVGTEKENVQVYKKSRIFGKIRNKILQKVFMQIKDHLKTMFIREDCGLPGFTSLYQKYLRV